MSPRQLTIIAFLLLVGCLKNIPPPVTLGSVEGSYSFGAAPTDGTPGIDAGSIYFGGKRVVLWVNGNTVQFIITIERSKLVVGCG